MGEKHVKCTVCFYQRNLLLELSYAQRMVTDQLRYPNIFGGIKLFVNCLAEFGGQLILLHSM